MMQIPPLPLASIEAVRPVFLIIMGAFLMVIAWRLSKISTGWAARMIVAGALMLGFGYVIVMPLCEAGLIERYSPGRTHYHGTAATALAWQVVKLISMNCGWLFFGLGVALHAKLLSIPAPRRANNPPTLVSHESVA
ncbi:MAG: hypothetical protein ABIT37_12730 [Luteolibacter sp.]